MELSERSSFDNKKIVIFDGECAFCNESVLFIRKHNDRDNLFYCSNQSETGKKLIKLFEINVSPEESLIYLKNGRTYFYSSAALEIAKELDHFWAMLSIFLIVPKLIRDRIYKFIAKHRKSLLGTSSKCSLDESDHFKGRILS